MPLDFEVRLELLLLGALFVNLKVIDTRCVAPSLQIHENKRERNSQIYPREITFEALFFEHQLWLELPIYQSNLGWATHGGLVVGRPTNPPPPPTHPPYPPQFAHPSSPTVRKEIMEQTQLQGDPFDVFQGCLYTFGIKS